MAYDSIEHLLFAWFEDRKLYPEKVGIGGIKDLAERLTDQVRPFRSFFRAHEKWTGYDFDKCLAEARERERNPDVGYEGLDSGIARLAIAGAPDPPAVRPEWVKPEAHIKRLPSGRLCRVINIDDMKGKALVKDLSKALWINYTTLEKSWSPAGV